ncbi:MAG: DNA-3-methyladenine glycosylase 2 family protein [Flavobacteriales bacterium]|nr:DNA-3-methyladenine glycosylase 2 family protein [Flavobacteriales bacterium]
MELNHETLKKAYNYLSKDDCLNHFIIKFSDSIDISERFSDNYAKALADLIIEQQVSFKAAITIKKRFSDLISNLSNNEILELKLEKIKSIGVSYRKAEYIQNVYIYFQESKYDFNSASNKDVITELISIKGIGLWSAQMFLIFVIMRIDIFSPGDLALMNSLKINYKIDISNKKIVESLVETWSPYKSVASLLLWKSIEEKYFYS